MVNGNNVKKKVVVIGAGVVGGAIAFNLSRRANIDLTVIDHAEPGSGASNHSFAWINSFGKEPVEYHDLNRRSQNMWDRFARRLNANVDLHWGGELRWVATQADADDLGQRVRHLQSRGYSSRMISKDEVSRLEPDLNLSNFVGAEFSENDGHVDPIKVAKVSMQRVQEAGGKVFANTSVSGFDMDGSKVRSVRTSEGNIECDVVVLSAGLGSTGLASMAGIDFPQQKSPGSVGRTNPQPKIFQNISVLHTPPPDVERGPIHLRQFADGTLMIGEGSQESVCDDDSQEHADDLLARAKYYVPALKDAKITPVPVGYRPMPMDGLPVLGFTETVPNMYIAVMHSGVTLAPLVGEFSAIEIAEEAKVEIFDSYRLERFSLVH